MQIFKRLLTITLLTSIAISLLLANSGDSFDFTGIFLVVLLILSGLFSGSEVALLSLSDGKVQAMVDDGLIGASAVKKLKSNPNRMLIIILIGNNLVNIGASVLTTAWASRAFGNEVLGVVTGVLTILILIFGEIFPKVFAQKYADRVARIIAKPLIIIGMLLYPIVILLEKLLSFTMRFIGEDESGASSLSEIKALVKLASHQGHIEDNIEDIISNSLKFTQIRVKDIMTPKSSVIMVDINSPITTLKSLFLQSSYSRIPVYEGKNYKIRGVINIHQFLKAENLLLTSINQMDLNSPLYVYENEPISKVLMKLQAQREHMAIVLDRREEFVGITTLENIIEEIVGEIFDETEKNEDFIKVIDKNSFDVKFDCTMFEMRKYIEEFEPLEPDFKSISNFFNEAFDGNIVVGSKIERETYSIEVAKMFEGTILILRVERH